MRRALLGCVVLVLAVFGAYGVVSILAFALDLGVALARALFAGLLLLIGFAAVLWVIRPLIRNRGV